jgi:chemotaxis protein methyltransferase CheR
VSALAGIVELVLRETGIVLPTAREAAILAAVDRAAPGLDPGAFMREASGPARGRDLIGRLIDEVTVQETSFVRDRGQLDTIGWRTLLQAAHAAGSGTIRVWSAGCASGEEAYTLSLLAAEAFAPGPVPVDVLGTDISGAALAAAQAGQYRERAVRALAAPLRSRYLDQQPDGSYLVAERLRKLVRFRRHNLARDPTPPLGETGFDLVACRNVLIYFDAPLAGLVIEALERSLRRGGVLMLGAADALRRPGGRRQQARSRSRRLGGRSAGQGESPERGPRRLPGRQLAVSGGPGAGGELAVSGGSGAGGELAVSGGSAAARELRLAAALDAAGAGDRDRAFAQVASLLADDPLDAEAHFVDGLVALEAGDPARAATSLRRGLYADATFALAAFTLGRAYDALGDADAGRRAYQQALRTLDPEDDRHEGILQQIDIGDIAAACRARLGGSPCGSAGAGTTGV